MSVPSLLYFGGMMNHNAVKLAASIDTVVWFTATPKWMGSDLPLDADQVEI